jgi:hypothetical protein
MIALLFLFVASIIGENTFDLLRLCHVRPSNVNDVGGIPRFIADGKIATNLIRVSKISTKYERCNKLFYRIHQDL